MDKLQELRSEQDKLAKRMQGLIDQVGDDNFTDEQRSQYDGWVDEFEKRKADIDQVTSDAERRAKHADLFDNSHRQEDELRRPGEVTRSDRQDALAGWLLGRKASKRQRDAATKCGVDLGEGVMQMRFFDQAPRSREEAEQMRAQAVESGTATEGANIVQPNMIAAYESALLDYTPLRTMATVIRTNTGEDLPIATDNTTSQKGALITENTAVSEQDVAVGRTTLGSYMFTSNMVRVSYQFLTDVFVNTDAWLGNKLGERIGRIQSDLFTFGTGSSQPDGYLNGAHDSGITLASNTAVAYDELIDLQHSLDPAYRDGAMWSFHDSLLKQIRKIKDNDGNPIWVPGLSNGAGATILGSGYRVNQAMPTGASAKSLVYGRFDKFIIRDVNQDFSLIRLDERYAELGQVAFLMWQRSDSKLIDAGTHPMVYATSAA